VIKILNSLDIDPILDCFQKLETGIVWTNYGHKGKQAGLQFKNSEDPWTSAVGKSQGQELLYSTLNSYFENTEFENIIKKYNLKRTRLMWVGPYACYSMHQDTTPRIHIPLITNPECYFVFKDGGIEHLPVGNVYWTNTTKLHTFMNCSDQHRLHLVGIIA
jgi:hypothetical protein